jgi:hydrogenase maturation protease
MKCLIVFLGSSIAGDDAAGYDVYMRIKNKIKARMAYLGTDLFKLYGIYEGEEKLIIVDAVYGADDVIHLKNNEIFSMDDKSEGMHFLSAIEALKILKTVMKKFPEEVHLIGLPAKSFNKITYDKEIINKAIKELKKLIE